jgi:hypothetical protein
MGGDDIKMNEYIWYLKMQKVEMFEEIKYYLYYRNIL